MIVYFAAVSVILECKIKGIFFVPAVRGRQRRTVKMQRDKKRPGSVWKVLMYMCLLSETKHESCFAIKGETASSG
jgi:hypothetical protein